MEPDEQKNNLRKNIKNFVRSALTTRRLPIWLALLAIILTLPSLNVGLLADDHWHRIAITGSKNFDDMFGSPMDIFRFIDGNPQRTNRIIDTGIFPWWTYPEIKAAFWRPVTSLTHWLDYHLWPNYPALMHAQSILWFAALVTAVSFLYRRFMGLTVMAGVAALLYAIDDAHGQPVAWLANRNTIIATLFGILAIIAHDRWRRDRWYKGAVLGPLLLVLSLLSAEVGITTCAFLLAYELFISDGLWLKRCKALIPYVCVVVIWRIVWTYLGYGTDGMGIYDDPVREPLNFLASVIQRAPIFLLGQLAGLPSSIGVILNPKQYHLLWLAALVFLALLTLLIIPLLRQDRQMRFWCAAIVLSVLPICTTFPIDRLLLFVGIGAMGFLTRFFDVTFGKPNWRPGLLVWRIPAISLGIFLILVHLIIAPLALPVRTAFPMGPPKFAEQFHAYTPLDSSIAQQDLIIVNPPVAMGACYWPVLAEYNNKPIPRHTRILAPAYAPISVYRPDEQTLVIRPKWGYLGWIIDRIFRSDKYPFSTGQLVELTGMTVEITELNKDNRPAEAAFRFAVPLEHPSLRWLQFSNGNFVPFTPPAVGQSVDLPGENPLWK